MPDVSSSAPALVGQWIVFDVHKNSLVAGILPAQGGTPQVSRIENTERAIRRFFKKTGDPGTLAVAYEAGPCGFDLYRLLCTMGIACDVIAPSLIPVRAGDRVKTDRRDAKKLVRLYRAGELSFVAPPTPMQEGLRDLVRCRDDLRCARTAARHRVAKALLRYGHIYRESKSSWTLKHREWVDRQRLGDREPWADPVAWLCSFRGIAVHTALGLLAEIGDFHRFSHPRELMSYLGLVPSEYSSGEQQHRGHITKTGNRHARRLLVEAAWHYQHPARLSKRLAANREHVPPPVFARAWQAQVRPHHRHRTLVSHGKRPTVANVAVARELCGFIWAAMTKQPLREAASAALKS